MKEQQKEWGKIKELLEVQDTPNGYFVPPYFIESLNKVLEEHYVEKSELLRAIEELKVGWNGEPDTEFGKGYNAALEAIKHELYL